MSTQEKQEGDFKMKKPKAKQLGKVNEVVKVDLKQPEPEAPIKVDLATPKQEVVEKKVEQEVVAKEEQPVIQEITEEEVAQEVSEVTQELQQAVVETKETGKALPENIEKLVSFMEETGGTVEDYVRLNADYSKIDAGVLLREYYKKSKPYLDSDEISTLIEDAFLYDEDIDDERDIRRKNSHIKKRWLKPRVF